VDESRGGAAKVHGGYSSQSPVSGTNTRTRAESLRKGEPRECGNAGRTALKLGGEHVVLASGWL
jgi:hypothetical protein